MANDAWNDNTALSTEANKRYATTESKLKNLKNKATLVAQTFGDDLNPTIQKIIESVSDFIDKLSALDASERMQKIRTLAIIAPIGPALIVISKISKVIGGVTGAIGKFALAVGKAGGGWKGFLSVIFSSPAVWIALSAAIVAGAVALCDYISGVTQAKKALEGMQETAENWKYTAAETFYGKSDGLSAFGLTEDDFTRETGSMTEWLNDVVKEWSNGKRKNNTTVKMLTDSFKTMTESTRTELEELKETADEGSYTSISEGLEADIKTLDSLDTQVEKLLKKRKSGKLTEKDKIKIQELIDTREAIEVKYKLSAADADGYETIRQQIEAEIARAKAAGNDDADVSVYEDAVKASAEGMAAMNSQIDAQYDKEYALIQLIEDETERQNALTALNNKYNDDRRNAAQQYAETLASVIMPVWNQEDIQNAGTQIDELTQKMIAYSAANKEDKPKILEEIENITSAMDEGAVTEYISLLTQVQSLMDSGMTEEEVQAMFPDIDFSTQLDQIAAIQEFLNGRKNSLPGLYSMFAESLPEEVLTIATDLNMDGAQARWDAFAANPGAITTDAVVNGYTEAEGVEAPKPKTLVELTGYDLTAYNQFMESNPVKVQYTMHLSDAYASPEDALKADNVVFWENGVEISATLVAKEMLTADKVAVLDEDGTMHILITPEVVGTAESVTNAGNALDNKSARVSVFGSTTRYNDSN